MPFIKVIVKKCPIRRFMEDCLGDDCAWWCTKMRCCAVLGIRNDILDWVSLMEGKNQGKEGK